MRGLLLTAGATFLVAVPWGARFIARLVARGIGKNIRAEEPDAHQSKAGTPTMGGLYFLAVILLVGAVLAAIGYTDVLVPLLVMIMFGVLGAFDDLEGLKDAGGVGWLARSKLIGQWILALVLGVVAYLSVDHHALVLPLGYGSVELGGWFVPIATLAMVAFANAVNLTDGMDGLAAGTSCVAFGSYAVLAFLSEQTSLGLFASAVVGALLAFLWYNAHPAQVFMGDVGSEALGAGLAVIAMMTGHWLVLPVIGLVFVLEAGSVILQVASVKYARVRGVPERRIFRMSPLHYHYELGGQSEVTVTVRFWIVGLLAAMAGILLALGGS